MREGGGGQPAVAHTGKGAQKCITTFLKTFLTWIKKLFFKGKAPIWMFDIPTQNYPIFKEDHFYIILKLLSIFFKGSFLLFLCQGPKVPIHITLIEWALKKVLDTGSGKEYNRCIDKVLTKDKRSFLVIGSRFAQPLLFPFNYKPYNYSMS